MLWVTVGRPKNHEIWSLLDWTILFGVEEHVHLGSLAPQKGSTSWASSLRESMPLPSLPYVVIKGVLFLVLSMMPGFILLLFHLLPQHCHRVLYLFLLNPDLRNRKRPTAIIFKIGTKSHLSFRIIKLVSQMMEKTLKYCKYRLKVLQQRQNFT